MLYSILVREEKPNSVLLKKKRGKEGQVKMIWITHSSYVEKLTISEEITTIFLFNFYLRVFICFHVISFFKVSSEFIFYYNI